MKRLAYLLFSIFIIHSIGWGQNHVINLISPSNLDTIITEYPVFHWQYFENPMDRSDVKYSFVLVKLKEEQSAAAGLLVNTPLLYIEDVNGFQLSYPFDAPDLKYNNRYGWKLQKKVNNVVISESEPWEFILYKEIKIPKKYALLNITPSATIYDVDSEGFFFMLSKNKTGKDLRMWVYDEGQNEMDVQLGDDKKKIEELETETTGRGFYFLQTASYPMGVYTLKVKDIKGNEYSTRFRVK